MILDNDLLFANTVPVPLNVTGIQNYGSTIDTSQVRDVGVATPINVRIQVINPVTSGGLATVQFMLISDSQDPPRIDGVSENIHFQTVAIPVAQLSQGQPWEFPLPVGGGTPTSGGVPQYAEFLGIQLNIGTAALTGGNLTIALLQASTSATKIYPGAVNF